MIDKEEIKKVSDTIEIELISKKINRTIYKKYILEKQVYLMMTTKLLLLIGEHQFQVFIMMVNWEM